MGRGQLFPTLAAALLVSMRKFDSTRLQQLLAVKLTAAFTKSRTIDMLPYHQRLSDCEYSAEDVYEVFLVCWLSDGTVGVIPLSATKSAVHIDDEEEQGAVQGCTPKDPGVKVI